MDKMKSNMADVPILVFPYCEKEFHVHVDASFVVLGVVLTQPGEADIDNPISFAGRKISTVENNYITAKREGIAMVYALKKF